MAEHLQTEVLILGCGIAGGLAALQLADSGIPVTLVTRSSEPTESNTFYAQGGIVYEGENDSPELLAKDIFRAGAGHCYPQAVNILAEQGPQLVRKILFEELAIEFDKTSTGKISLAREASHSMPRILHVSDMTGEVIQRAIVKAISSHPNIDLLSDHTAIDLLTPSHHSLNRLSVYSPVSCTGAYLLDQKNHRVICCLARKTIMATGGLGQIFLCTSNPSGARGDGFAMAYRAGARLINCEFVQFHPTTFHYRQAPHLLISEAVRGAGARLVDVHGNPFMQKYDSEWKDLAPRDVVARSVHEEMLANALPNVYLDLHSYIPVNEIKDKFPTIYQNCMAYGIDPTRELIPIVPAAHYACGGVWVDEWGQSTIENLFVVGEVSCTGIHGANRLASTSLLEGLVWGHRAALHIQQTLSDVQPPDPADYPPWIDTGVEEPDQALINQDMTSIRNTMWNYVGLVRTTPRMARALRALRNLENEVEQFYRKFRLNDSLIGLRNAIRAAIIVTLAAWQNKESMGCHYRV